MTDGPRHVLTGLDVLSETGFSQLQGKNVGLLANQAAVDLHMQHAVDLIRAYGQCRLVRLFAGEGGFRSELDSNARIERGMDLKSGLPVVGLYSAGEREILPRGEDIRDLDVIVIDLAQTGSRHSTSLQTMASVMRVAGAVGTRVVVLDRPNPLGGEVVEGPGLRRSCHCSRGFAPIPIRHGMTIGELAVLIHQGVEAGEDSLPSTPCELEVIPLEGWARDMHFQETGLSWVMPLSTLPTPESCFASVATQFFEASNISEGRGTTKPYELFGAPFVDSYEWLTAVMAEGIPLAGAALRPTNFIPRFDKFADKYCSGLQLHVTDRREFSPVRLGLSLIAAVSRVLREKFAWRRTVYEFDAMIPAIDLLYGSNDFRKWLDRRRGRLDISLSELLGRLVEFESWFREARKPFLLY